MSVFDKIKGFFTGLWERLGSRMIVRIIHIEYILIAILCILCLGKTVIIGNRSAKPAKTVETSVAEVSKPATATICTAGDLMLHSPFIESSYYLDSATNTYDFSDIFTYIKDDYNAADYTVATFEGSLTGEPYSGYPMFRTPESFLGDMKNAGIDLCLLGNNHIYDGLDDGLQSTMEKMDALGFDYLGIRKDTSVKNYRIQDINGIKVGMIDYVYETTSQNGAKKAINAIDVSDESAPLINSFHEDRLDDFYKEIGDAYEAMKNEGAEYCIAYMHWGYEYKLVESDTQDAMAQKICDIGFNAIIGSHPHVIQPVDLLTSADSSHQTLVCYAIGNHLSNQRTELMEGAANGETEDGYMVTLTLSRDKTGTISLDKVDFLPTWVYRYYDGSSCKYYILPLDDPSSLAEKTKITDLGTDPEDSIARTNAIIGEGVEKVQSALPIK